ncbi:MAG: hypothetical protein K0Q89_16 [Thermomicrobiales bacterium]|jgi:hypothetical protein|nr:hypothetical protein [Thermomicrobiales bacterium]
MSVHLTPDQARKLGIDVKATKRKKTTGRHAPAAECSDTRCCTCGEIFTTIAAEDRHVVETRHARYESVL